MRTRILGSQEEEMEVTGPILIIGYGNPLRSDDGIGPFIIEQISKLNLQGVDLITTHQLNVELAEEISRYKLVILVDASETGPPVYMEKVEISKAEGTGSSHQLNPEAMLFLVERLYQSKPEIYLCSILGEDFNFGMDLSETVLARADQAIGQITKLIKGLND
jgi:hydrogenase maturation protease